MGVGAIRACDLDDFVKECDRLGGVQSRQASSFIDDFSLLLSTEVDESIDPFSDEYVNMQIDVYREISNRELNQKIGEQKPMDIEEKVNAPNPFVNKSVNFIASHARTIFTSILVSQLPDDAKILDVGCGLGLSTEMFAFSGAEVHAVDINPLCVDLVSRRTRRKGYNVKVWNNNFDTFKSSTYFDLIFFYECLHHSIKPWETISSISNYLRPNGRITFAGEPINDYYWKSWGVRLDFYSVYCIRKLGWFESGWTQEFIIECFKRAKLKLNILHDIGLHNGIIGVATHESNKDYVVGADVVVPNLINDYRKLQESYNKLQENHDQLLNSRWMKLRKKLSFIKPF